MLLLSMIIFMIKSIPLPVNGKVECTEWTSYIHWSHVWIICVVHLTYQVFLWTKKKNELICNI